jgi:hypothetical protein
VRCIGQLSEWQGVQGGGAVGGQVAHAENYVDEHAFVASTGIIIVNIIVMLAHAAY